MEEGGGGWGLSAEFLKAADSYSKLRIHTGS